MKRWPEQECTHDNERHIPGTVRFSGGLARSGYWWCPDCDRKVYDTEHPPLRDADTCGMGADGQPDCPHGARPDRYCPQCDT